MAKIRKAYEIHGTDDDQSSVTSVAHSDAEDSEYSNDYNVKTPAALIAANLAPLDGHSQLGVHLTKLPVGDKTQIERAKRYIAINDYADPRGFK